MADLFLGTTGTGIEHHKHRVKALVIGSKHLHHVIGQSRIDARPDIDYLIIPFVISDEAHIVVGPDFFNFGLSATRSEEHTSELQSLMRISYAVFCLKKKQQ